MIFLSLKYRFKIPDFDGMMNAAKCEFLYKMVSEFKGEKGIIVEIGSYKGCSTTWLAMAGKRNNFSSLLAIDLFTGTPDWNQKFDTFESFMNRMRANALENFVVPIRGDSREVVKTWGPNIRVSLLHIDGGHTYDAVKGDIDNYIPRLQQGGIVIFDDYDSSHPDVMKAVDELIHSGDFEVAGMVKEVKNEYGSIALIKI
jgi:MMP 1-O-methyltransferase